MGYQAQILIADDEEKFRKSIVTLFEKEGYRCDDVADANQALEMIEQKHYDLLVADIRMPGSPDLALVRKVTEIKETLPVIVITGHPSLDSAVDSVGLPVSAYLIKPFEFKDLLSQTQEAIKGGMVVRAVEAAVSEATTWQEELQKLQGDLSSGKADMSADRLVEIMRRHAVEAVRNLQNHLGAKASAEICEAAGCTLREELKAMATDVIAVLEDTRASFKSQQLKNLRESLESKLESMQE